MPAFDDNSTPSVWVKVPVPTPMSTRPPQDRAPQPSAPVGPPPVPTWNAPPMLLLPHSPAKAAPTPTARMARKKPGQEPTPKAAPKPAVPPLTEFVRHRFEEDYGPSDVDDPITGATGFLLPDGTPVRMGPGNTRYEDHRSAIPPSEHFEAYGFSPESIRQYHQSGRGAALQELLNKTGIVRMHVEPGSSISVDHSQPLTRQQKSKIYQAVLDHRIREYNFDYKGNTGTLTEPEHELEDHWESLPRMRTRMSRRDRVISALRVRFRRPLPSWVPTEEKGNEENTGWVATPESSWIAGLKHTEAGTAMTTKKGGRTYNYPGLDLSRFRAWLKAQSKGKWWWSNVGRVARQSRDGRPVRMQQWDPTPNARQNRDIEGLAQGYAENPHDDQYLGALTDALAEAEHPQADLFQWYWHHGRDAFARGFENADTSQFDAFVHPWNLYELYDHSFNVHQSRPELGHLLFASMRRHVPEGYPDVITNTPATAANELAAMGLHSAIPPDPDRDYETEWRNSPFHAYARSFAHAADKNQLPQSGADHQVETHPDFAHEMYRHASGMGEFHKSLNRHLHVNYENGTYRWKHADAEPSKMRRGSPIRFQSEGERQSQRELLNKHPELQSLVSAYLEHPEDRQRQGVIADWMMDHGHPDADRMMWYHKHGGPAFEQAFKGPKIGIGGGPLSKRLEHESWLLQKVPDERIRDLLFAAYNRGHDEPEREAHLFLNSADLVPSPRRWGSPMVLARRHESDARMIAEETNDELRRPHIAGDTSGAHGRNLIQPRPVRRLPERGHEHEDSLWEEVPGYTDHMEPALAGFRAFRNAIEKHADTGYQKNFRLKYAAMRAPAGGAIVRGIYQPGGQALPAEASTARPKAGPRFARLVAKLRAKRRV